MVVLTNINSAYFTSKAVYSNSFTPRQVSSLILWLDGNRGVVLNSSTVSTWTDLSGRGNSPSQVTSANQPVYNSNPLNGFPTLAFSDANSTNLVAVSRSDLAPTTITTFAVCRYTATQSIGFVHGRGDTGFNGYWSAFGNANITVFGGTTGDEVQVSASSSVSINEWCIVREVFDGSNVTLYKNGTSLNTHALSGSTLTYAGNPNYYVGITTGLVSGRFLTGDIAEIIIYNKALDTLSEHRIEKYLGRKYAITVA